MNIKDYEYIVEIASQGSISRAADKLSITPGALSKYLSRIEQELNIPLFMRLGNRFSLTRAGQRYVELGRLIMELDGQLARDIAGMVENGDAALHLGVPRGMNSFMMERVLPAFYESGSSGQISVERGGSRDLITMLEEGKLDLCIAYANEKRPHLIYEKLASVQPVLAVSTRSGLLKKAVRKEGYAYPVLEDEEWLEQSYICITTSTYSGRIAEKMFAGLGKHPPVRLYAGDTDTALSAVENGIGNTFVLALPQTERLVRYLSLPGMEGHALDVFAVTRKEDFRSREIETLIGIVKKYYKDIY